MFPSLDDIVFTELLDLLRIKTEPLTQDFIGVFSEQRGRLEFRRVPAKTNRPTWHLIRAGDRVLHRLHDTASLEIRLVGQLHRVEDRACRHARIAKYAHCLAFISLTRPGTNHLVDLGLML